MDPPQLSVNIPKLSDISVPLKEWKDAQLPTEVLLVTVKDPEFLSCLPFLKNQFKSYCRGLGPVYFGDMGDDQDKVQASLLRCSEGSAGPGGALSTVKTAITMLQPKAVFCVGFCGGLSDEKTKLGDVVISHKLTTYAHKTVMNDREESRGVVTPVSKDITDLIKHAANGWNAPLANPKSRNVVVHNGEFLSGPELVKCGWRRQELLEKYPRALAIEMEGEGIFAAAHDLKMEWVVVKGISDYVDETKSSTAAWKPFASVMAVSVVVNMLKGPGILKDWVHYEDMNYNHSDRKAAYNKQTILFGLAFVILLVAIGVGVGLGWNNPQTNKGGNGFSPPNKGRAEDPVATLLQSISGGSPGQVNFKGRTIGYRAQGRVHSFDEPWVYDGTAWDVESGVKAKVNHYEESEDAIQDAVKEVIKKLKTHGILQD